MICQPWITDDDLVDCCDPDTSSDIINAQIEVASEVLYALSGRQYSGSCSETVRPCSGGSALAGFTWDRWTYPWLPLKNGATWINIGPACGCHITYDCGCKGIPQVNLGRSDVSEILSVVIDGTELGALNYRLDHGRWLVRTDGENWPCCQDLAADLDAEGAWYVELVHGVEPPTSGKEAAKKLACELIKACVGADCDLPQRVTSIVRQGVSMTLIDPQEFLSDLRTSIYQVDLFLKAANPNGLVSRATAWSPEVRGRGRRVGVIGS
jgi:hypothetical protein